MLSAFFCDRYRELKPVINAGLMPAFNLAVNKKRFSDGENENLK